MHYITPTMGSIMCQTNKGTQKGLVAFGFPALQTCCSANVAKR